MFTKPETKKPGGCKNAWHRVERGVTSEPAPGDKCYFYSAGRTANTDSPPDLLAAAQQLWRCGSARGQSLQQEQSGAASLRAALEAAEGLASTKMISLTEAGQNSSRRADEHRGQALSFLHRHPYVLGKLTGEREHPKGGSEARRFLAQPPQKNTSPKPPRARVCPLRIPR